MAKDRAFYAHQEWLGYVQPVGLVVSIPAMLDANARINQNVAPDHRRFLEALPSDSVGDPIPEISDLPDFLEDVLGWSRSDLAGGPGAIDLPASLEVSLPDYNETLQPTYALRDFDPAENARDWILLVKVLPKGTDFDSIGEVDSRQWQASPQAKFERLLRQTRVPIGLLIDGQQIRLVYAPEKELSGHITFKLAEMVKVAGRPILAAFHMLLCAERLYSVGERERLPAILENSRKYQNVVSTKLASQVLEALYELLRGFQAADDQTQAVLLHDVLAKDPDHVYRGLLTTLLRMVFVLYAEDRGLLSTDPVFANYYSITGLYERLRVDDGRYPDTMDQRYGAWAQLLTLFRLIYRGGSHAALQIPAREGYLFDPDRYLFLEGRYAPNDEVDIPRVPDGVLFRVLSKLLLLDGERISYRTLAVEQIGSVYEAIMGFELHVASGPSIAIKPAEKHGAPTSINLEALLATPAKDRVKWLADETDQKLTGKAADLLKAAASINDLIAALDRRIASAVTPGIVAKEAMIFQPSNERRRSGSHYTPSSLTGPIVEAALAPVLKQLGENPTPAQILNLKVCDPAMGSGAFLVEACRQLGDSLSRAWHAHNEVPALPLDEDEALHAQRQVAQRCLYGVDKNPMATDLAKLSLWLATLAKDHPFTFLDHSLRAGDSLVGLTRKQIAAFNWNPTAQMSLLEQKIRTKIETVSNYRQQIFAARDDVPYTLLKQKLDAAEDALNLPRQIGDAVVAAFFAGEKAKDRENTRLLLFEELTRNLKTDGFITVERAIDQAIAKLRTGANGIHPFHWELEFPEVFAVNDHGEQTAGFDAVIGNPPFLGGIMISSAYGTSYLDYLTSRYEGSGNRMDLVGYFFRRAFALLASGGTLGLIATKTIAKGDTRSGTLKRIVAAGGEIYRATKRLKWPGVAQVVVSVIHIIKNRAPYSRTIDGRLVSNITAFLFDKGTSDDPTALRINKGIAFKGYQLSSQGFLFDDNDEDASPLRVRDELIDKDPMNAMLIRPYIGGEEINNSSTHAYHRYAINFGTRSLREAERWPDLLSIVEQKVRPARLGANREAHSKRWWMYGETRRGLTNKINEIQRVLVHSLVCTQWSLALLPSDWIYSHSVNVICSDNLGTFALLQSRIHELWARFFGSSMKDDLRYTPTDCFETFPFPPIVGQWEGVEESGRAYYDFRAQLMIRNNEGMTETYNHFHDPNEDSADIQRLRELRAAMDRTVLVSYGWQDLQPVCEFFPEFDEEDKEDEGGRPKRKKYRYRWPEEIHDEVLARLLDLNRQRALEEGQLLPPVLTYPAASAEAKKPRFKDSSRSGSGTTLTGNLFSHKEEEA